MNILCLLGLLLGRDFDSKLPVLACLLLFFAIFAIGFYSFKVWRLRLDCGMIPIFAICLLVFGRTICPPTSWDELTYQLAIPMRWLSGRGDEIFADNPYSAFPSLSGIAFRILMSNGGLLAPRVCVLVLFVISALSLNRIISVSCGKFAKIALMTAFCASFPILMISASAYSDIFILSNFAVAVLVAQEKEWIADKGEFISLGIVCGILAGAAASVKLTGLIIIPAVLLLLLSNRAPLWRNIVTPLFFLVAVFIFAGAFYARSLLITGNPFYPYFSWLFSSDPAILEMSRYHHAIGSEKYGILGIREFFLTPLLISLGIGPFDGLLGYQYAIIVISSIIVGWHLCRERTFFKFRFQVLIVAVLCYLFWFISSRQVRFVAPAIFATTIVAVALIKRIKIQKSLLIVMLALTIVSIPRRFISDCLISWKTAVGIIDKEHYTYASTGPGYLKACKVIHGEKVVNKRVMLLFENRGLYIPADYLIATPFFQSEIFTPPENVEMQDVINLMREQKISHVLVGLSLHDPDRLPKYLDRSEKIAKLIGSMYEKGLLIRIWDEEGFAIFRVEWDNTELRSNR